MSLDNEVNGGDAANPSDVISSLNPMEAAKRAAMVDEAAVRLAVNTIFHDPGQITGLYCFAVNGDQEIPTGEKDMHGRPNIKGVGKRRHFTKTRDALTSRVIDESRKYARESGEQFSIRHVALIPATFRDEKCFWNPESENWSAKEEAIASVCAGHVDHDTQPRLSVPKLRSLGITPGLSVRSGGVAPDGGNKQHDYIVLAKPLKTPDEIKRFEAVMSAIIDYCGSGDTNAKKASHPLRSPGGLHRKGETTQKVEIIEANKHRYSLEELETIVAPIMPKQEKPRRKSAFEKESAKFDLLEAIRNGEDRHSAMVKYAMSEIRAGRDFDEVEAVLEVNLEDSVGIGDDSKLAIRRAEIKDIVRSAVDKVQNDDGFLRDEERRERVAMMRDPAKRAARLAELEKQITSLPTDEPFSEELKQLLVDFGEVVVSKIDEKRIIEKIVRHLKLKRNDTAALNDSLKEAKKKAAQLLKWADESAATDGNTGESAATADGISIINLRETDHHEAVQKCWEAVTARSDPREPPLLFLSQDSKDICRLNRRGPTPTIESVSTEAIAFAVGKRLRFRRGGDDARLVKVPHEIVSEMGVHDDPPLLSLLEIRRDPFFTVIDGKGVIVHEEGYYEETGIYLTGTYKLEPIPAVPTDADTAEALQRLEGDLFEGFPFFDLRDKKERHPDDVQDMEPSARRQCYGHASRTNALAPLIEAFMPGMLGNRLMHTVDKAKPRTGGSTLVYALHYIAFGTPPPVGIDPSNEAETEKRLGAVAASNAQSFVVDNADGRWRNKALEAAATAEVFSTRRLGLSENITAELRCMWFFNGNNIRPQGALAPRVNYVRLDSQLATPQDRSDFKFPGALEDRVKEKRAYYVWAILVLIQNWIAKGMPKKTDVKIGGFQKYVETVGGVLEAAGRGQWFLANRADLKERVAASDTDQREILLTHWLEEFGKTPVRVGDPNISLVDITNRTERVNGGLLALVAANGVDIEGVDLSRPDKLSASRRKMSALLDSMKEATFSVTAELRRVAGEEPKQYRIQVRVESEYNAHSKAHFWYLAYDERNAVEI